jgi:predicted SprT family Zn-dependent metalloprotease
MRHGDARVLAELHMEAHGLLDRGWMFMFDRAAKRFGRCNYTRKLITLSHTLVELNIEAVVEQTILHEVAHAVVGPHHGHGPVWRRKAIEIGHTGNRCYGENVATPKKLGIHPWNLVCDTCGSKYPRLKRTSRTFSCTKCNPRRFDERYILRLERNVQK